MYFVANNVLLLCLRGKWRGQFEMHVHKDLSMAAAVFEMAAILLKWQGGDKYSHVFLKPNK